MYDDYREELSGVASFWSGLPPGVRAAAILAIPFIVVDFFNYFSAGTALVLSLPILALLYAGCGSLGAKFAGDGERDWTHLALVGATSGLLLWVTSTVVNVLISLILGTLSLGTTLLLGVPYLCLCAPFQLIGGGLAGAAGGLICGLISGRGRKPDDDDYFYQPPTLCAVSDWGARISL